MHIVMYSYLSCVYSEREREIGEWAGGWVRRWICRVRWHWQAVEGKSGGSWLRKVGRLAGWLLGQGGGRWGGERRESLKPRFYLYYLFFVFGDFLIILISFPRMLKTC